MLNICIVDFLLFYECVSLFIRHVWQDRGEFWNVYFSKTSLNLPEIFSTRRW